MRRRVVLRYVVPLLVVFHLLMHVGFGWGRWAPDLFLVALLLAAREVGMGWGASLGLLLGLMEDSFSVLAFGANALALTLLGVLGSRTRDLFVGDSVLFYLWYLAGGKLLRDMVHWLVVGEALRGPFLRGVLVEGGLAGFYAAAVGILLMLPFLGRDGRS